MDWMFIIYVVLLLYIIWQASKQKTLYVFNPIVSLYLVFATFNIYPLVTYEDVLPRNIVNVTHITCVINMVFMLFFRKQFLQCVQIQPDKRLVKYAGNRRAVVCFFLGIIISAGFYTGVTQLLLSGADVEDFRMTSDVGMGFVKAIPEFGVPYLVMEYFIMNRKLSFWKAAARRWSRFMVSIRLVTSRNAVGSSSRISGHS